MIIKYFTFSISIVFISFIVGMIITALLRKSIFYNERLSHLNFIKNEITNKFIGVGIVKWIVKNTFCKFLNDKIKCDRKMNISEMKRIRNEMTKSEVDHLFAFIFVLIFIFIILFKQKYLLALVMLFVNTVMNLYPSLLQQQNKRRIDKIISKFENMELTKEI